VRVVLGALCEVRPPRPRPINADGEIITMTPAVFSLKPAALEVFVPAPAML
jgi:diacylglycerol kinase family enzyme